MHTHWTHLTALAAIFIQSNYLGSHLHHPRFLFFAPKIRDHKDLITSRPGVKEQDIFNTRLLCHSVAYIKDVRQSNSWSYLNYSHRFIIQVESHISVTQKLLGIPEQYLQQQYLQTQRPCGSLNLYKPNTHRELTEYELTNV